MLRIPEINTRNKKDRTLNSPNILSSFSDTGSKGMNFSTAEMKLLHVANIQTVAQDFPRTSRLSQTNFRKNQEQKDAISTCPISEFLQHTTTLNQLRIEGPP